jgi:hypothetical protein
MDLDLKQTALGFVLLIFFLLFQFGVFRPLGTSAWVLGVIVLSVIFWLMGKATMPKKQPPQLVELWQFATIFAVVATVIIAYGGMLVQTTMPQTSMPDLTPLVLGLWLVIFGAATLVTGWTAKWGVTIAVGIIWLFSAFHTVSYLDFAFLVGLPFIIYGLISKR